MSFRDLFKKKRRSSQELESSFDTFAANLQEDFAKDDFLGKAAVARNKARDAEAAGDFDTAWGFYQEQKEHFLRHAARCNFTKVQTLALDASVSESLANILRQEGKHYDALVHIVYWVAASQRPTKVQEKKLPAYFNRCKLKTVSIDELQKLVEKSRSDLDFVKIRDVVSGWQARG